MKNLKEKNIFLENIKKELEESNQYQENRIKSLTLELEKTIKYSNQKEEEFIYLNQEYNKMKKSK